jgi:hypothetical protein
MKGRKRIAVIAVTGSLAWVFGAVLPGRWWSVGFLGSPSKLQVFLAAKERKELKESEGLLFAFSAFLRGQGHANTHSSK